MKQNPSGAVEQSELEASTLLRRIIRSRPIRALRYRLDILRNRYALRFASRPPLEAFTRFYRNPHQMEALIGPALKFLQPDKLGRPLHIVVLACSTGAEPYSFAAELVTKRPEIDFQMVAGDINEELVTKCQAGEYSSEEVFSNKLVTDEIVAGIFDPLSGSELDEHYCVRSEIKERINFKVLDALDPNLAEATGKADILLLQNVLFNLQPEVSTKMFENALQLLHDKTVVFLDGMDVHQRKKLTARHGLKPLDFEVETIHSEVRRIRENGWPGLYWGIEPYWPYRKDTLRRYATVYFYEKSS